MNSEPKMVHLLTWPTLIMMGVAWLMTSACYMNNNAATASLHNAEVRAETERQRIEARQAAQEAHARAEMAQAYERTSQQRIDQIGASERLYSQQNYLIAKQSEGTNRLIVVMGTIVLLIVMIGGAWLVSSRVR